MKGYVFVQILKTFTIKPLGDTAEIEDVCAFLDPLENGKIQFNREYAFLASGRSGTTRNPL